MMGRFLLIKSMQKGQTLLEAVVALAILIMIISASSIAIITGVNNTTYEKNVTTANKYVQEGVEYLRSYKNGNPATFSNYGSGGLDTRCLDALVPITTPLPTVPPPPGCTTIGTTQFRRYVEFDGTTNECNNPTYPLIAPNVTPVPGKKAVVTVEWQSGKCTGTDFCNKTQVANCF